MILLLDSFTSRELFQMNIFNKVTYLNIDGIWFYGSELNFLLFGVFREFPDIPGDPGDPRSISKARLG